MMTSPGNSTRIKTRLRNATFLARNSKGRHQTSNRNHDMNHRNNRSCGTRTSSLKNNGSVRQMNNINKSIGQDNNGNTSLVRNVNGTYKGKFAR